MRIEPFTYYKSADNKRAFLVADVADPEQHPLTCRPDKGRVVTIEWGKAREDAKFHSLEAFQALITAGKLVPFTPQI